MISLFSSATLVLLAACAAAVLRAATHHSRYTAVPSESYDFVVVGGGTAGCLIAAELAEEHPDWRVLLLEAGGALRDSPISEQSVPGGAPDNVAYENINWGYSVQPQRAPLKGATPSGFAGRSYPIPRGRGLGGSNELNYMLHVRGTPGDYDAWEAATGDARWGAASMLRAEQAYESKIQHASKAAPADPAAPPHAHGLADAWVAAGAQSPYGAISGSYNDGSKNRSGAFHYEHAVRNGLRQSTARQFLGPRMLMPNLHVIVGATVGAVVLEDVPSDDKHKKGGKKGAAKRAVGVSVTLGPCRVPSLSAPAVGTLIPEMPCLLGGRRPRDVGRTLVRQDPCC